jgi:hypothetical protein
MCAGAANTSAAEARTREGYAVRGSTENILLNESTVQGGRCEDCYCVGTLHKCGPRAGAGMVTRAPALWLKLTCVPLLCARPERGVERGLEGVV